MEKKNPAVNAAAVQCRAVTACVPATEFHSALAKATTRGIEAAAPGDTGHALLTCPPPRARTPLDGTQAEESTSFTTSSQGAGPAGVHPRACAAAPAQP